MGFLQHKHLVEYKSIKIKTEEIKEIKLFQDDKLIIVKSDGLLFYDIINDQYLYNYKYNGTLLNKAYFHLELMDNDKLILSDSYNPQYNLIIIYKFIEEKTNKFKLIELSKRYILKCIPNFPNNKINTALYIDQRIIVIGAYIFHIYKFYDYNFDIQLQTKISSDIINVNSESINGFIFNNKIVGLFNIQKQKIEFYSLFDFKKVQQTTFPFNDWYRQIAVFIYNCNNNDMILIGNVNKIYLYSFKNNYILKEITYIYYDIRGVYKGKNNSYYFLTTDNFFKIDSIFYNYYPLIKRDKYDFSESYFLLTAILREDNLIINHKNKIIFFKKKEKESKNTVFNLSIIIKIIFIILLIYILFKI